METSVHTTKYFPTPFINCATSNHLKLFSGRSIPPFMPFTHHLHLYKMYLDGSMEKPPEIPLNLAKLSLVGHESEQDVISVLEKPIKVVVIPPSLVPRYCHLGRDQKQRVKQKQQRQRIKVNLLVQAFQLFEQSHLIEAGKSSPN